MARVVLAPRVVIPSSGARTMRKATWAIIGSTLLGAGSAHAGLITIDLLPAPAQDRPIASNNDFIDQIDDYGVTRYTLGASLGTDQAGTISYYYYGKEAGYSNQFIAAGGSIEHTTGFAPYENRFADPLFLGSQSVGAGWLDFSFCAYTSAGAAPACVSNFWNDTLRYESLRSIAISIVGDSAWLFWDDSGAGPDDNHDDMLVRAVFRPAASVPEPGTLGLLGLGLLGATLVRRRAVANR